MLRYLGFVQLGKGSRPQGSCPSHGASRLLLVGRGWPVEGVRQSPGVLIEERDAEAVLQGGTCEIGVPVTEKLGWPLPPAKLQLRGPGVVRGRGRIVLTCSHVGIVGVFVRGPKTVAKSGCATARGQEGCWGVRNQASSVMGTWMIPPRQLLREGSAPVEHKGRA